MEGYKHKGPIDCDIDFDAGNVQGKTAIVTGGANGIGELYVRGLLKAGAFVCVGDLDTKGGEKLVAEFPESVKFVRCNVTDWDDQVELFREAVSFSPTGKVSYVVANAGIIAQDEVFLNDEPDGGPTKPNLKTIDVNIYGTLYTTKLATHYFVKQNGQVPSSQQEDTCLVLIGSGAAFLDCLRIPQYSATKWAARGIMHALRRTAYYYGSRVNVISPWYVKTKILSEATFKEVSDVGVQFVEPDDAGQCLLRILSDKSINGHTLFLSPRRWAPRGYIDLDIDDYPDSALIQEIQEHQMKHSPASKGLFV